MNKFFTAVALTTALMFSLSANAQFQAPAQAPVTVEQAKSMPDDTFVVLEGNITQQLGDEKYMFQDQSGTVVVEIDNEEWRGVKVNPTDVIVITGTTDKDFMEIEVDVDTVNLKK